MFLLKEIPALERILLSYLPFHPYLFPPLLPIPLLTCHFPSPSSALFPFPPFPLEVGPLHRLQLEGLGER